MAVGVAVGGGVWLGVAEMTVAVPSETGRLQPVMKIRAASARRMRFFISGLYW